MDKGQIHSALEIMTITCAIGAMVFGFQHKVLALALAAIAIIIQLYLTYQRRFHD